MKTKIVMSAVGIILGYYSNAQINLDSLVQSRNPSFIAGKVPTYYTPGHKDIAEKYQTLITEAVAYYEKNYSNTFAVKLAVIDSSQWLSEVYPFGFVFSVDGWIGMNTGMSYESFKEVYGLKTYHGQLEEELNEKNISPLEMIESFFSFYAIHELGHYYMDILSNSKSPDNWTNEFSASYLSYQFFVNNIPRALMPFELFCQVDRDHYRPKHASIADFNAKYAEVGLENYLWYHSNFYFLAKELYGCRGTEFISSYERAFNKSSNDRLQQTEIVHRLDRGCDGLVGAWVRTLESRARR